MRLESTTFLIRLRIRLKSREVFSTGLSNNDHAIQNKYQIENGQYLSSIIQRSDPFTFNISYQCFMIE